MSELRVPMLELAVEIVCGDGRSFSGRVFVPGQSGRHDGPMRAEEWLNEPTQFFPFVAGHGAAAEVFNKRELMVMTVAAQADEEIANGDLGATAVERRVSVECGERRFSGIVRIDMPENQTRVLDYLNRTDPFLTLRDGDRHHLIQKKRITRVLESREA